MGSENKKKVHCMHFYLLLAGEGRAFLFFDLEISID
jgi:hypothetical protein